MRYKAVFSVIRHNLLMRAVIGFGVSARHGEKWRRRLSIKVLSQLHAHVLVVGRMRYIPASSGFYFFISFFLLLLTFVLYTRPIHILSTKGLLIVDHA